MDKEMEKDLELENTLPQNSCGKKILARLDLLHDKLDAMDKSNKKFIMMATMGRMDALEKENADMKMALISILDYTELLLSAVPLANEESLQDSMEKYYRKISRLTEPFGIQKIPVRVGDHFNPKEQECVDTAAREDCGDNTIVEIIQCGYLDKAGSILRYAKVVVNKSAGKDA